MISNSKHRMTVSEQQLIDVLVISIIERARRSEIMTVEETLAVVDYFNKRLDELLWGDTPDYTPWPADGWDTTD